MYNAKNVNSERIELTIEYMNEHIEQSITVLGYALNYIHPLVLKYQLHLVGWTVSENLYKPQIYQNKLISVANKLL